MPLEPEINPPRELSQPDGLLPVPVAPKPSVRPDTPHELERAHELGAEAAVWARELQQPELQDQSAQAQKPTHESVFQFLYRGNKVGFGLATVATVVSSGAAAISAWAVSAAGESPLFAATAAAATSYIWYPAYFALNHIFRDRQLIQRLEEQGDSGANFRNWGSRVTQTVMGEGIWLAAIIPSQVALVNHLGLSAGAATLVAHIPLALSINASLITPYRNLSNWMWGLDRPRRGSGAQEG